MKKKIIFLVLLALIVFLPKNVKADCSDAEITRLQKLANNVNINYTYNSKTDSFDIIITNLKKDLILKDYYTHKTYNTDKEVILRNQSSGIHKYYIYVKDKMCEKNALVTKYMELPFYNRFYKEKECKGIENYVYCKKWVKKNADQSIYLKNINEYRMKKFENQKQNNQNIKEKNILQKIQDIYIEYYYIILPLFIAVISLIIYIMNKNNNII